MKTDVRAAALGAGTICVVLSMVLRVVVMIDPMPIWSMDPLTMWVPQTGLGPMGVLLLDLLGLVGAALVLSSSASRVHPVATAGLIVALAGIVIHGVQSPADAQIGMPWAAAFAGGLALAHLPRGSLWRSVALGALLSVCIMLVSKGVVQVSIEHPATVRSYEQTRTAFLESQGWSPDSVMARNYERRLYQPEANGWFGLSNVYASFMASMALTLAAMLWAGIRTKISDRRVLLGSCLGACLCLFGLAISRSKGGGGALLLALCVFILTQWYCRPRPNADENAKNRVHLFARLLVVCVPVFVLAGIVARGLIGERIGELSILFRWFYMEGATRVFIEHPLLGVGPAGFKDAYLLAKPPISPEEVTSAHNLPFDWIATLGIFGLGALALFAMACRSIGTTICARDIERPTWELRAGLLACAGLLALTVGFSAVLERALLTPEMGIVRAFGLLGGIGIAWTVLYLAHERPRLVEAAAGAGALVLLAHLQIEVTGVWAGAAPLAAGLIGLACTPRNISERSPRGWQRRIGAMAIVAAAGLVVFTSGLKIWRWEQEMNQATAAVKPAAVLITRMNTAEPGTLEFEEILREMSLLNQSPTAGNGTELMQQVQQARIEATRNALPHLQKALTARPDDLPTRQALVRLVLRNLDSLDQGERFEALDRAINLARHGVAQSPDRSGTWRLLAQTLEAAASRLPDPTPMLTEAYQALGHAEQLDPYGLAIPLKLVDLAGRLGLDQDRRQWAARVLEINSNLRLDPLRQLTDVERDRYEKLVKNE